MLYLPHPPDLRVDVPERPGEGSGLLDVIDVLWDSKWLIAATTV